MRADLMFAETDGNIPPFATRHQHNQKAVSDEGRYSALSECRTKTNAARNLTRAIRVPFARMGFSKYEKPGASGSRASYWFFQVVQISALICDGQSGDRSLSRASGSPRMRIKST